MCFIRLLCPNGVCVWAGNSWGHREEEATSAPIWLPESHGKPIISCYLNSMSTSAHTHPPTHSHCTDNLTLTLPPHPRSGLKWGVGQRGMCVFLLPGGELTLWAYRGLTWSPPLMKPQSCVLECSLCLRWRSKDQNVVAPIRSFCKLKDSVWGYWKRAWAFTALIILNFNLWMVEKKKCPLVHFSYITCIVLWQSSVSPSGSKAHESAEKLGQNLSQCFPLAVALSHKSTGSSRCLSMGHKYEVLLKKREGKKK